MRYIPPAKQGGATHMLGQDFLDQVNDLYHPAMGTEVVGPLLYTLVRTTRPRHVLEVGAGYTTLFILKALADNMRAVEAEKVQMAGGQTTYLPQYYRQPYQPVLHAIDTFGHPDSTAQKCEAKAKALGIDGALRLHNADFRGYAGRLPQAELPLDFVWLDCGGLPNYMAFQNEYWKLIDPNGGLLLIHSLVTNTQGQFFLSQLKLAQATNSFHAFEILSLLEPHKGVQNSVTMVRMISKLALNLYTDAS
jgi:hypothetical protein